MMSTLQSMLKTEFSFIVNTAGKILTFALVAIAAYGLTPLFGDFSHESRLMLTLLA